MSSQEQQPPIPDPLRPEDERAIVPAPASGTGGQTQPEKSQGLPFASIRAAQLYEQAQRLSGRTQDIEQTARPTEQTAATAVSRPKEDLSIASLDLTSKTQTKAFELPWVSVKTLHPKAETEAMTEAGTQLYPIIDVPLPLVLSFLVDPDKPIEAIENQERLEFIYLLVGGTLDKAETFGQLSRYGSLCKNLFQRYFSRDDTRENVLQIDRLNQLLSSKNYMSKRRLEEAGKNPGDDPVVLFAGAQVLEILAKLVNRLNLHKEIFISNPTLFPHLALWRKSTTLSAPDFEDGVAYLLAHLGHVAFSDEKEQETYTSRQKLAEKSPLMTRIRAALIDASFKALYAGDKRLLPPTLANRYFDEAYRWLHAFPPEEILEEISKRSRVMFAAFGMAEKPLLYGRLDLGLLSLPYNQDKGDKELNDLVAEFLQTSERQAGFYTTVYPWLLHHYVNENPRYAKEHWLSGFARWLRAQGLRFIYFQTESLKPRPIKEFEPPDTITAGDYIYELYSLLTMIRNLERVQKVPGFEKIDGLLIPLQKAAIPAKQDPQPSFYLRLIDALVNRHYLEYANPQKTVLRYTSQTPLYVSATDLAQIMGISDPTRAKDFADACLLLTDNQDVGQTAKRFLAVDLLRNKLGDDPAAAAKYAPWITPYDSGLFTVSGKTLVGGSCATLQLAQVNNLKYEIETYNLMHDKQFEHAFAILSEPALTDYILECKRAEKHNRDRMDGKFLSSLQVKLDGYRTEAAELEASLQQLQDRKDRYQKGRTYTQIQEEWERTPEHDSTLTERRAHNEWLGTIEELSEVRSRQLSISIRIEDLESRLADLNQEKPYPVPPVVETVSQWVRPYIASTIMQLLSDTTDQVIENAQAQDKSLYSLGTDRNGSPVVTAKSRAIVKLLDILRQLDTVVSKQSGWPVADNLLLNAQQVLAEYEKALLNEPSEYAGEPQSDFLRGTPLASTYVDSGYVKDAQLGATTEEPFVREEHVNPLTTPGGIRDYFAHYPVNDLTRLLQQLEAEYRKQKSVPGKILSRIQKSLTGKEPVTGDYTGLIALLEELIQEKQSHESV